MDLSTSCVRKSKGVRLKSLPAGEKEASIGGQGQWSAKGRGGGTSSSKSKGL